MEVDTARRHYKKKWSNYQEWEQRPHAEDYLLFPGNMSSAIAIDEVSLTRGELYTIVSSRTRSGRKGKLIAVVAGTKAEDLITVLSKLSKAQRDAVQEVTLYMSPSMRKACESLFIYAKLVTDGFHVVRLCAEAMQKARIDQRWKEIDKENKSILRARRVGKGYKVKTFSNGDTPKQLLARSRYILYKLPHQWTQNQMVRAATLFQAYPEIEKAYRLHLEFRAIYEGTERTQAGKELMKWIRKVQESGNEYFLSVAHSLINHWDNILNFFNNRSTNAHAESLNAQIKLFRANLRGVTDTRYFLYRLQKIFA
jgi:transposase